MSTLGRLGKYLFFVKELPGKMVAIGSDHSEDPPRGQMTKKLVFVRELSGKRWPLVVTTVRTLPEAKWPKISFWSIQKY